MRHLIPGATFSKWSLPVRLLGLALGVIGFGRIVQAPDAAGIAVAVIGSLAWQFGTLLEKRSPLFRLLSAATVGDVMRTERMNIPGRLKVANLREQLAGENGRGFLVTVQDGYEAGIVLPDDLHGVTEAEARHAPVQQFARPICYAESIREDDSALAAFTAIERGRRDYISVVNRREELVGVVTGRELDELAASLKAAPTHLKATPADLKASPVDPAAEPAGVRVSESNLA